MTLESHEAHALLAALWSSLQGPQEALRRVEFVGAGSLPSAFSVSSLAAASIAAAGLAAAELRPSRSSGEEDVTVDRRLCSMWFAGAARPMGWKTAATWDAIAGDYAGADGWIRLHTNAPHHRAAAISVLGCEDLRDRVAATVTLWPVSELESRIVAAGGCAAMMRSRRDWARHPQGAAVAAEPLIAVDRLSGDRRPAGRGGARPLHGVRVLDLTRVLAGPVATRFLAGLGADVLRIDPPWWEEDALVPEVTLGKRCARLDLREADAITHLKTLLAGADVLIHGYRPGALDRLGLGAEERRRLNPGLIDVSLNAYGWSGPWAERRGFDSLVQMSSGLAEAGMRRIGRDRPTPLPVQALDHAQGYMLAASALRGLQHRAEIGGGWRSRSSLARVAALLSAHPADPKDPGISAETPEDLADGEQSTHWGPLRWLKPPVLIAGAPLFWDLPPAPLGTARPAWREAA